MNNINSQKAIQVLKEMYIKYGVDTTPFDLLSSEKLIRGMKGIIADLDANKNRPLTKDEREYIKDIYSQFC